MRRQARRAVPGLRRQRQAPADGCRARGAADLLVPRRHGLVRRRLRVRMILHRVSASAAVKVLPPPYAHIYRVRADVLLKVLGGFAEENPQRSRGKNEIFTLTDLDLI